MSRGTRGLACLAVALFASIASLPTLLPNFLTPRIVPNLHLPKRPLNSTLYPRPWVLSMSKDFGGQKR